MTKTARISLPLIDAAQALKHVTVNETAAMVDALLPGTVRSRVSDVPAAPVDGDAFIVPDAATGSWAGHDGNVALFLNGGWVFCTPWVGWRVFCEDEARHCVYSGAWREDVMVLSAGGAATLGRIIEIDHVLSSGTVSVVASAIPDKFCAIGVTARVISAIGGASAWSLGVSGDASRYGSGFGVGLGAHAVGLTASPQTYYGGTDIVITSSGGAFSGGEVRLAIHGFAIVPPDQV